MDPDAAQATAGALIDRAPGTARNNVQLLRARVAQVAGVLNDLVPSGDAWSLMSHTDPPPGVDQLTLDWLAVLDGEALYSVVMLEEEDESTGLQVRVMRIPFDLIEVARVTDNRVYDHGAWRLQRSWLVRIGERRVIALNEDRILGARLDSVDRFTHELARRAGWPVNTELADS
jgi:hypothetical protein